MEIEEEWSVSPPAATGSFDSREQAQRAAKEFAIKKGFDLVVKDSNKSRVALRCAQEATKRSHKAGGRQNTHHQRSPRTKKVGCLYEMKLVKNPRDSQWSIAGSSEPHRNLPWLTPAELSGLQSVRRFLSERDGVNAKVIAMYESGGEPRAIWHQIKASFPWVNYKGVDNANLKVKQERLDGMTPIEALYAALRREEEISDSLRDDDNRVVRLFFSPKASRPMLMRYSHVLLLDCTYKTNKYMMPLLHVVGVTGTHQSSMAGCCFMSSETTESYTWALSKLTRALPSPPAVVVIDHEVALIGAIEVVWPSTQIIICRCYISKNITTNCNTKNMDEEAFKHLLEGWSTIASSSSTEDEFLSDWNDLKPTLIGEDRPWMHGHAREYALSSLVVAFAYIDDNNIPFRRWYASYSINNTMHFGHTKASIAEGAHWFNIKVNIKLVRGSLLDVTTASRAQRR